jgi:hypothetical protein
MDTLGDILAVGVEKGPRGAFGQLCGGGRDDLPASRVAFLDLSNPQQPLRFPKQVSRDGAMATCVGLTKVGNRFLLAVWAAVPEQKVDFYLSAEGPFTGEFGAPVKWIPNNRSPAEKFGDYQTMNFIHDQDGRPYLLGLGHVDGEDAAQLHAVDLSVSGDGIAAVKVTCLPDAVITLARQVSASDFQGAAGTYWEGAGLSLYSGCHFRLKKGTFKFTEFRPPIPGTHEPITTLGDSWVELYSGTAFGGTALPITDLRWGRGDVPDYGDVRVRSQKFAKQPRSVRWQLPSGRAYALYKKKEYGNAPLELAGTGRIEQIADLGLHGYSGNVVSSRLTP